MKPRIRPPLRSGELPLGFVARVCASPSRQDSVFGLPCHGAGLWMRTAPLLRLQTLSPHSRHFPVPSLKPYCPSQAKKRRILTLPRPRLVCVLALLDEYERMGKDERKMTPCASETLSHLAVQLGSFKERNGDLSPLSSACPRRRGSRKLRASAGAGRRNVRLHAYYSKLLRANPRGMGAP